MYLCKCDIFHLFHSPHTSLVLDALIICQLFAHNLVGQNVASEILVKDMLINVYGWNSPGRTSLLDECHQNVLTLGLLMCSVLIEIACLVWSEISTVKMISKNIC